jgi:Txe/YoeB family toxin of Txe-Axe toxin-antitoxin module
MQSRAKSIPLLNVDSWVSYPYVYAIHFTMHFMQLGKNAGRPFRVPGQTEPALRPLSYVYSRRLDKQRRWPTKAPRSLTKL